MVPMFLCPQEKEEIAERSRKIIAVADEIISAVDSAQLLAYLGMKSDARADAGKIKMLVMNKTRTK